MTTIEASGHVSRIGQERAGHYSATLTLYTATKSKRAVVLSVGLDEPVALGEYVHVTIQIGDADA